MKISVVKIFLLPSRLILMDWIVIISYISMIEYKQNNFPLNEKTIISKYCQLDQKKTNIFYESVNR